MKNAISNWLTKSSLAFIALLTIVGFSAFRKEGPASSGQDMDQRKSLPAGWSFGGNKPDQYLIGIDSLVAQHGHKCATFESKAEDPEDFCTIMQFCTKKEFSGKRIRMTGYIKSRDVTAATMWVRVDDYGNKVTADFDNMMDRPVSGTNDWTKCEIVFDVPPKCSVYFGFILSGTGKIWVDNVSFETVDLSVDKTAAYLDQPFPEQYQQQLDKLPAELPEKPPVNLDFEE